MILISLDLQKSHDTAWHFRVINLLKKWNKHGNKMKYLANFSNFKKKIRDYTSNKFILENGVPQGSPFNIFLLQTAINNLINNLADIITNQIKSIIDTHTHTYEEM
jgi:hypothetical protein